MLSKNKFQKFQMELRNLLEKEGYTTDQIDQLVFERNQYVRFGYPRFEEFRDTVPDCNDKDRIGENVDRDLIEVENLASLPIFGFNVFSYSTISYLYNEADYQEEFARDKAEEEAQWEYIRFHLSNARSFKALKNKAMKMIEKMKWRSGVVLKNRVGFLTERKEENYFNF